MDSLRSVGVPPHISPTMCAERPLSCLAFLLAVQAEPVLVRLRSNTHHVKVRRQQALHKKKPSTSTVQCANLTVTKAHQPKHMLPPLAPAHVLQPEAPRMGSAEIPTQTQPPPAVKKPASSVSSAPMTRQKLGFRDVHSRVLGEPPPCAEFSSRTFGHDACRISLASHTFQKRHRPAASTWMTDVVSIVHLHQLVVQVPLPRRSEGWLGKWHANLRPRAVASSAGSAMKERKVPGVTEKPASSNLG